MLITGYCLTEYYAFMNVFMNIMYLIISPITSPSFYSAWEIEHRLMFLDTRFPDSVWGGLGIFKNLRK